MTRVGLCLQLDSIFVQYICTWRVHHTLHVGFQMTRVGLCLQLDSIFVQYICTWRVHHTLHVGFQMTRVGLCLQLDSIFVQYICTWRVHHTLHVGFQMTSVCLCIQFDSIFVAQYTDSLQCDLFDLIRAQPVGYLCIRSIHNCQQKSNKSIITFMFAIGLFAIAIVF